LQPAANNRGDGGGQRKHHGDLRHQALGWRSIKQVADDGTADDNTGASRDALHGAPEPQVFNTCGKGTTGGCQRKKGKSDENDSPPAKTIGNGAVPKRHQAQKTAGRLKVSAALQAGWRRAFAQYFETMADKCRSRMARAQRVRRAESQCRAERCVV
jgi:hypothetical protein